MDSAVDGMSLVETVLGVLGGSVVHARWGRQTTMSIVDRVKREAMFNATSVQTPPNNIDQE